MDWTVDVFILGVLLYITGNDDNDEKRKIAGIIVIGITVIMRLFSLIFGW